MAVDSQDRVHIIDREPNPAIVGLNRDGALLNTWGGNGTEPGSSPVTGQPSGPSPVPVVDAEVALELARETGVASQFEIGGDRVVAYRRKSKRGGGHGTAQGGGRDAGERGLSSARVSRVTRLQTLIRHYCPLL